LWSMLAQSDLQCGWPSPGEGFSDMLSSELCAALNAFAAQPTLYVPATVMKPVSRPRKQRFTARNYPLSTPLEPSMVRVGQTIKRRVRVNRGLLVEQDGSRRVIRVVRIDDQLPDAPRQLITIGMVCEARRAGRLITGIVSAVHSDGRLTLLVPHSADAGRVEWNRVLVRPAIHLRVISTDHVLFLRMSPDVPATQTQLTSTSD